MTASTTRAGREPASSDALERALGLIASIPDHPTPGVVFRDLTPLFADGAAFADVVDALIAPFAGRFDAVAGLEARGFLLAGAIAMRTGAGLVPIRKQGKLPRATEAQSYDLEYGSATIEAHRGDLPAGSRVLLVDDVLATGGTLGAAIRVADRLGWDVVGASVVLEIDALDGRAVVSGDGAARIVSLFHV
ncbi:adenine phosphoribosyltransferase [Labedella gwakjiensis]|uniref:Adenine phosphoribosyltransferase n=1 Tax=Labedella gwakjiensis TaxID=390269 RepID=A0A2P8H132_9MICO|nr:adenine phosphoribosyltransferase [Labedella gwakjiensis]PSL39910.1 adenine phosphoribosyltransferase [Labedella gwakjiensis]RUQ85728.1 adenine phosphoribosyltransferase [Labedella gwakjiensis]